MTVSPYEEPKPIRVIPLQLGRYSVQSQTRPEIDFLVKWNSREERYTCNCEDGIYRNDPLNPCKHIEAVKRQFPVDRSDHAHHFVAYKVLIDFDAETSYALDYCDVGDCDEHQVRPLEMFDL